MDEAASAPRSRLARVAPGLAALLSYRRGDLPHDLAAGLSVAAVALPVGVAYAELAGFAPAFGLYASILPLLAYALFGTSRQLIVGPDAATCALVAASVAPLAGGDPALHAPLAVAVTALAGLFCVAASLLRLGAIADFLSKPILVGFLNGVALHIMSGQFGKLIGVPVAADRIVPKLIELASGLGEVHGPTLVVGISTLAVLQLSASLLPRLPAPLLALVLSGIAVALLGLEGRGVAVVGAVPGGLPALAWPSVPLDRLGDLAAAAGGVALVSFTSLMLPARAFAAKNRYDIDADREVAALGAANLAAALAQTFAVSGADSRTAVSDAAGGRTQLAGVISAVVIALVVQFLTGPLRFVPVAALGAVLVRAAFSLLDLATLRRLWRFSTFEFALSVLATVGVIWVGAVRAIVVAVALAILHFVHVTARPRVEILGEVEGLRGFHAIDRHDGARTEPGLLLFRFNAPLVFFNAPYFKQRARAAIDAAGPSLRWFVLDALPMTTIDITGYETLEDLAETLRARGASFVVAGRMTEVAQLLKESGLDDVQVAERHFPTLRQAVQAWRRSHASGAAG
jgi:high affinity sulfate transporter 1